MSSQNKITHKQLDFLIPLSMQIKYIYNKPFNLAKHEQVTNSVRVLYTFVSYTLLCVKLG